MKKKNKSKEKKKKEHLKWQEKKKNLTKERN